MADVGPISVQKALHGVDHPASRDVLVQAARDDGAEAGGLEAVPGVADREYGAPTEVAAEIFH